MTELLWDVPDSYSTTILLAHGAGAAMDSPGMNDVAAVLVARGIRVARFEFAYMAARRSGTRKPPPRADTLLGEYRDAIAAVGGGPLLIGGRSMGGRVATMVADDAADAGLVYGVVCLAYPFHPPGKPEQTRTAHLEHLRTPTLIVQGERDEFGTPADVAGYSLSPAIEILWLPDGDHGLVPRKSVSGFSKRDHLETIGDAVAGFASRAPENGGG
ncbi:alpha/beta hydrolase family protein [Schumannella luteola]